MSVIDRFIAELLGSEFAEQAHQVRECIVALDLEGDHNPSAAGLYEAVVYVISDRHHTVQQRLEKVFELTTRKGKRAGTLRQLTGW
jgi:hypothetical protein